MSSYFKVKSLVFAGASLAFLSGSALGQVEGVCFVDVQQQGSPCVCVTEDEFDAVRQTSAVVLCQRPDSIEELSRLSTDIDEEIIVPQTAKGNNGIGNDEVGDPPGGGNTGNDVEGARTAQTTGPGAKGPDGSRSDNKNNN